MVSDISLTTFGFDFLNEDLAEGLAGFGFGGLDLLLGYFPGFLFDILDDGVNDIRNGVIAGSGAANFTRRLGFVFPGGVTGEGNLEVVREEVVNSFDGGVNDFGAEDFRFDNRFEDGFETGIELVNAKDSGQKQGDAGN